MAMHQITLALLLAGCISVSAYYVPGTYPQEFLTNAPISGAVQLLLCNSSALFGLCSLMHADLITPSSTMLCSWALSREQLHLTCCC
jgi:hypothetical protein